jgi:hypothetical protein
MKKIIGLAIIFYCSAFINISAQDEEQEFKSDEFKTIFGGKKMGGYGAIGAGYSIIDDKDAIVLNARGGVVLGHNLALGLTGTGFMNEYTFSVSEGEKISLVGGYGGFFIEPIILPRAGVHVSFPVTAGVGGITYTTFKDKSDELNDNNESNESQSFFIVEPGVEVEFNLFKFMRMSVFGTYRFVSELNWDHTSSDALNNFSTGLIFKFGKF